MDGDRRVCADHGLLERGAGTAIRDCDFARAAPATPARPTSRQVDAAAELVGIGPVHPSFDHVASSAMTCRVGAMVIGAHLVEGLPADLQDTFAKVNEAARVMSAKWSRDVQLPQHLSVVRRTPAEEAEWEKVYGKARAQIAGGLVDKAMVNKALMLRGLPLVP